jgi:hypothetical protein
MEMGMAGTATWRGQGDRDGDAHAPGHQRGERSGPPEIAARELGFVSGNATHITSLPTRRKI